MKPFFERVSAAEYSGPHRTGTLQATYAQIVEAFGQPHLHTDADFPDDPFKVAACWMVRSTTVPLAVVAIWNYKNASNYTGNKDDRVEDVNFWSVYTSEQEFFGQVEHFILNPPEPTYNPPEVKPPTYEEMAQAICDLASFDDLEPVGGCPNCDPADPTEYNAMRARLLDIVRRL